MFDHRTTSSGDGRRRLPTQLAFQLLRRNRIVQVALFLLAVFFVFTALSSVTPAHKSVERLSKLSEIDAKLAEIRAAVEANEEQDERVVERLRSLVGVAPACNPAEGSSVCSSRGVCDQGRCVCDEGFHGRNCSIESAYMCAEDSDRRKAFDGIWHGHGWVSQKGGHSGPGSSIEYTNITRTHLAIILRQFEVRSFLDAPCGDYVWMPLVDYPEGTEYFGTDIVRAAIEDHRSTYTSFVHPKRQFYVSDIVQFPPFKAFDMIQCRDALQHLPAASVRAALINFNRSGSKYLLVTYYLADEDFDIGPSGYRRMNYLKEPWNWDEPLYTIPSVPGDPETKHMGVWKLPVNIPTEAQLREKYKPRH